MAKKILSFLSIACLLVMLMPMFAGTDHAATTTPPYKIWVTKKDFYSSPTNRLSGGSIRNNNFEVKEAWFYINTEIGWKWVQFKASQKGNFSLQNDELYIKNTTTLRSSVLNTTQKAGTIANKWSQVGRVWYLVDTKTKKGNQWISYSITTNNNEYAPVGGDQIYGPKPFRINYSPAGNNVSSITAKVYSNASEQFDFHYDLNDGLKLEGFSCTVKPGSSSVGKDLAISPGDYIITKQSFGYSQDTIVIKVIQMTSNYADVEIRAYRVNNN